MIKAIKQFFEENFSESKEDQASLDEQLHLAAAALLIEIAYADTDISNEEKQVLKKEMRNCYDIDEQTIDTLMQLAEEEVQSTNSSYEFTRLLNTYFEKDEKFLLVKAMWEIALTDGEIDIYEEAMIRKLADLLYVPHSDFIRAKISVQEKQEQKQ
jgi:uncharacterized tellurite resistance protein B-like protein